MAPKRAVTPAASQASTPSRPSAGSATPSKRTKSTPATPAAASSSSTVPAAPPPGADAQQILHSVYERYLATTPQRTKLLDAFMAFLVVVGALQFAYCVIGGNYPFNAFLSGFGATVGQFVLTASLRMQTNAANTSEFKSVSPERAFADYILGSLILHFFCVNFIN